MRPQSFLPLLLLTITLASCSGGKESVKKAETGFRASGTEPTWLVDINFETGDVRIVVEGEDPRDVTLFLSPPTLRNEVNRVTYTLPAEDLVEINIDREECTDAASGKKHPYSVNLRLLDPRTREERANYNGCGQYSGRGELTRPWRLVELDDEEIKEIREGERMPYLIFNLQEGVVNGDGSCNYFSGPATLTGDSVEIGLLAASKTVCPRISRESLFIDALRNRKHEVELSGSRLVLRSGLHEMVFKAVDNSR